MRKQAEKAKTEAREAVALLEQAHELLTAIEPLHAAIRQAEVRAATLEDWYWRTYYLTSAKQDT